MTDAPEKDQPAQYVSNGAVYEDTDYMNDRGQIIIRPVAPVEKAETGTANRCKVCGIELEAFWDGTGNRWVTPIICSRECSDRYYAQSKDAPQPSPQTVKRIPGTENGVEFSQTAEDVAISQDLSVLIRKIQDTCLSVDFIKKGDLCSPVVICNITEAAVLITEYGKEIFKKKYPRLHEELNRLTTDLAALRAENERLRRKLIELGVGDV